MEEEISSSEEITSPDNSLARGLLQVNLRRLVNDKADVLTHHNDRGLCLAVYYALVLGVDEMKLAELIVVLISNTQDERIKGIVGKNTKAFTTLVGDQNKMGVSAGAVKMADVSEYKRIKAQMLQDVVVGDVDNIAKQSKSLIEAKTSLSINNLWMNLGHNNCNNIESDALVRRLVHHVSLATAPENLVNFLKIIMAVEAIRSGSKHRLNHLNFFLKVKGQRQRLLQQVFFAVEFDFSPESVHQALEELALYDYRKGNNTSYLCLYNQVVRKELGLEDLNIENEDIIPQIISEKDMKNNDQRLVALPRVLNQIKVRNKRDVKDLFESGKTASDIVLGYYSKDIKESQATDHLDVKQARRKRASSVSGRRSQARTGGEKKPVKACLVRLFSELENDVRAEVLVQTLYELNVLISDKENESTYGELVKQILENPMVSLLLEGKITKAVDNLQHNSQELDLTGQLKLVFMVISFNQDGKPGPRTSVMEKFLDSKISDKNLKKALLNLRCAIEAGSEDAEIMLALFKVLTQTKFPELWSHDQLGNFAKDLARVFTEYAVLLGADDATGLVVSPGPVRKKQTYVESCELWKMLEDSATTGSSLREWAGKHKGVLNRQNTYGRAHLAAVPVKAKGDVVKVFRELTWGKEMADQVCADLDFSGNPSLKKINKETVALKLHATIATIIIHWGDAWLKDPKYRVLQLKLQRFMQSAIGNVDSVDSMEALFDNIQYFVTEWNLAIESKVYKCAIKFIQETAEDNNAKFEAGSKEAAEIVLKIADCLQGMMDINKLPKLIPKAVEQAYDYLNKEGNLDKFSDYWDQYKNTELLSEVTYLQLKKEIATNIDKFNRNIEEAGEMNMYERAVTLATQFGFIDELVLKEPRMVTNKDGVKEPKLSTAGIKKNTCISARQRQELLESVERARASAWKTVKADDFDFDEIEKKRVEIRDEKLGKEEENGEESDLTIKAFKQRRETLNVVEDYAKGERYVKLPRAEFGRGSPVVEGSQRLVDGERMKQKQEITDGDSKVKGSVSSGYVVN